MVLVLAACGSGDDLETETADPASSEEFEAGVLAQGWMAHGRSITVRTDGAFEISYRVYRWCSTDPAPCDELAGDTIGNGGRVEGTFDGGAGPTWTGTITESVEPDVWPLGPVQATYDPASDTLAVTSGVEGGDRWDFCGPKSQATRCGA
jgi:hypothetical protein